MPLDVLRHKIEKIQEWFRKNYVFDRIEFGEVMVVASTAALLVSAHAAISIQDSLTTVEETNSELDQLRGMMSSDSFESSMEALETTAVEISEDFRAIYQGFNSLESGLESMNEVEKQLRSMFEFFRWIVLISIIGIVTGLSLIYI